MCLALPGQILDIEHDDDPLTRKGRINFGGVVKEASLACVPEAGVGDWVIVHAGLAISRLDEAEAEATLQEFAALTVMATCATLDDEMFHGIVPRTSR